MRLELVRDDLTVSNKETTPKEKAWRGCVNRVPVTYRLSFCKHILKDVEVNDQRYSPRWDFFF